MRPQGRHPVKQLIHLRTTHQNTIFIISKGFCPLGSHSRFDSSTWVSPGDQRMNRIDISLSSCLFPFLNKIFDRLASSKLDSCLLGLNMAPKLHTQWRKLCLLASWTPVSRYWVTFLTSPVTVTCLSNLLSFLSRSLESSWLLFQHQFSLNSVESV